MKPAYSFIIVLLLSCTLAKVNAQETATAEKSNKADHHQMNFVKINLTAIALKNYSAQYERIISKRFSLAIAYRTMPTTNLPFAGSISKAVDDNDPDTKKTIENLRMGNNAITPEARFYLGKGYGKGFYIALFYRHAGYTLDHLPVDYDDTHSLDLTGKLTANTGGFMLGAQWALGKHMCLDWWIMGPHYGTGNGVFTGVSNQPLTTQQQQVLRDNLEDLDIPLTDKTITVNASGATMKLDGPWGGIRAGILLGIKF